MQAGNLMEAANPAHRAAQRVEAALHSLQEQPEAGTSRLPLGPRDASSATSLVMAGGHDASWFCPKCALLAFILHVSISADLAHSPSSFAAICNWHLSPAPGTQRCLMCHQPSDGVWPQCKLVLPQVCPACRHTAFVSAESATGTSQLSPRPRAASPASSVVTASVHDAG